MFGKRCLLIVAVLTSFLLLLPAFSVANAKSPNLQSQVKNFMKATAGLKTSKAASYCVTEERSNVISHINSIPSGTRISLSKFKLVVNSQTTDTAEAIATYTIKIKLRGQKNALQSAFQDTFDLKLVNGNWLISSTTMFEKWVGLIMPSTPIYKPTATTKANETATATASPTSSGNPVKIGVIGPWSGPMGVSGVLIDQIIKVVGWQVKNQGGILGGREVNFIKGDDGGIISQSVAQAKKLALEDKVSILTLGGISAASFTAVANVAEELKVPYVAPGSINGVVALKYSACAAWHCTFLNPVASFIEDVLKPKTIAFLGYEGEDCHLIVNGTEDCPGLRDRFKAKGIDIIYEDYIPMDAVDLTPYLTKVQYKNPDVLISFFQGLPQSITINKQITELGGWGNIKYIAASPTGAAQAAIKMPLAIGTYVLGTWLPGSDEPGMKAFGDGFKQANGHEPGAEVSSLYITIGLGVKAVELAGSDDPEKVAHALRSGNLEWDSAWGPLRILPDGRGDVTFTIAQVQENAKLVKVWPY